MYQFLLQAKFEQIISIILIITSLSIYSKTQTHSIKFILFNYTPFFALSFYLTSLFFAPTQNYLDLISCLVFELAIFCTGYSIFKNTLRRIRFIKPSQARNFLIYSTLIQTTFFCFLLSTGDFGIFSDGSRISYLSAHPLLKYYTYAISTLSTIQVGMIAALITTSSKIPRSVFITFFINFSISLISGSKGVIFLWLLAIISMIDYRFYKVSVLKITTFLAAIIPTLFLALLLLKEISNSNWSDLFNLIFNRFFLVNDARSLAFDLRNHYYADMNFLRESFRSVSTLLGYPPLLPPLGNLFFSSYMGIDDGSGSNASFMALATFFSDEGYVIFITLFGLLGILILWISNKICKHLAFSNFEVLIINLIYLNLINSLSQDFLSFQLNLIISLLIIPYLLIRFKISPCKKTL